MKTYSMAFTRRWCEVMAAHEDVMDKYFAQIARVDNWLRLNEH